jgi:hypothetical protein
MKTNVIPYILPEARASYVHYWKRLFANYELHAAYAHLGLPYYTFNRRSRRYTYSKNPDYLARIPTVSHTTVLPDGSEVTWAWKAMHGPSWRRKKDVFREGHTKGVKAEKGRKADSFNREKKTMEFRNNAKNPSRWPCSNAAKRWAQIEDNRAARRESRQEIKKVLESGGHYREMWDGVCDWKDPRDLWRWS